MRKFESIELFSGAGGLALGLHKSGFRHVALVERDENACATIKRNQIVPGSPFYDTELIADDVRKIDFSKFGPGISLVAGGPPCQPFSLGGRHQGYNDTRDMFPQAIRAVRELRPLAFIFENVKGLLRSSFSAYFDYILLQLRFPDLVKVNGQSWEEHLTRLLQHEKYHKSHDFEYEVVYHLLNSANYGIPQIRQRVFIVGFRKDLGLKWTPPSPTHSEAALEFSKWASFEYWKHHNVPPRLIPEIPDRLKGKFNNSKTQLLFPPYDTKPWRTVRDAISDMPAPSIDNEQPNLPNHIFKDGAKSYPGHTGSPFDLPAKTLKAGVHGVPGGENMLRMPNGSIRYFTAREAARLQSFPDDHVFEGAWSKIMRQLGNAVPVDLAAVVGSSVMQQITTDKNYGRAKHRTVQSFR